MGTHSIRTSEVADMNFRDEYYFLSNFYPAPIECWGAQWPTTEHAYQWSKMTSLEGRAAVCRAFTPSSAKRITRLYPIRKDWDDIKIPVMATVLRCKFTQHKNLHDQLVATGDIELIEDNTWRDTFWGRCNGIGENNLGKLLMQIRKELT